MEGKQLTNYSHCSREKNNSNGTIRINTIIRFLFWSLTDKYETNLLKTMG